MSSLQPSPLAEVLKKIPLVYLATPYSRYPGGIELAFIDASRLAAKLLRAGVNIFCPIAHTHPLAIHGDINPLDHDLWMKADSPFMEKADALLIGKLPDWDLSDGVKEETQTFRDYHKPIFLIDPLTMELERDSYRLRSKKKPSDMHRSPRLLPSSPIGNSQSIEGR